MTNARRLVGIIGVALAVIGAGSLHARADTPYTRPAVLAFSTNLGTSGYASTTSVATDADGNLYVVGLAQNPVFGGSPRINTVGTLGGDFDAYVLKMNASGTAIEFVTLIGSTGTDGASDVALDASGNIYVAMSTTTGNLPVVGSASRPYAGDSDAYVVELSPDGATVLAATYLGGSGYDGAARIVVGANGRATVLVASASTDFPVTAGAEPTGEFSATVVVSLANDGGGVRFSHVTADTRTAKSGIAMDADGNVFVAGSGYVLRLTPDGVVSATLNRELDFECVTVAPSGDVYTAALDDADEPRVIYVDRWTHDLEPAGFESQFFPRYTYRVTLAGIAVDSSENVYLADFEDGSTENYYSPLRRIDAKGRFTLESVVADQLVGLALSPSRRVGVVANAYFTAPTFGALVPDRGAFRSGFVADYAFPSEVGRLPTVDTIERRPKKASSNKFRIVVHGSGFQPGALVFLGDSKMPSQGWTVKSATKLVLGADLSTESGPVALTIVNPDGGEVQATYQP